VKEMISCQSSRVFALEKLWAKELTDMRNKLMNPKKKNGRKKALQLKMLEEIEKVPSDIRNIALKRYLIACKQRNALAFFQWRSRKYREREGLI
jgi:NAD-specific glutamate dehydrogenase